MRGNGAAYAAERGVSAREYYADHAPPRPPRPGRTNPPRVTLADGVPVVEVRPIHRCTRDQLVGWVASRLILDRDPSLSERGAAWWHGVLRDDLEWHGAQLHRHVEAVLVGFESYLADARPVVDRVWPGW